MKLTEALHVTTDCRLFQEELYGWKLALLVPVTAIYRPHKGRDDDRLVGFETVRVWKRDSEMRFMAHLIQEKGKRRRKYMEFNRPAPLPTPPLHLFPAIALTSKYIYSVSRLSHRAQQRRRHEIHAGHERDQRGH